jgi:hypothetical protein
MNWRLEFAKAHEKWTNGDWAKVIFADEASFEIGKRVGQVRVWRRPNEKYLLPCLAPSFTSGRSSVMVWGAITATTRSPLIQLPKGERSGADFVRNVYDACLGDFWPGHPDSANMTLLEDGAPVHRCRVTSEWRNAKGLQKLKWPANSPDLNPIENLWYLIKAKVEAAPRAHTPDEMFTMVKGEWEKCTQTYIASLIGSMPERVAAVIAAKGGSTRW